MKNKMVIAAVMLLSGCANLKYPNWEQVKIETCLQNKPCVSKGITEKCDDLSGCNNWFRKRATIYKANTVLINSAGNDATYFQCETGLPIYKEHKDYIFIEEDHKSYLTPGTNTVTGQAFLTQDGGGVVTCAGESVFIYPDTEYFNQRDTNRDSDIAKGCQVTNEPSAITDFIKSSQCDAQGNFDFHKIHAGNYIISTKVQWNVSRSSQGGILRKKVTVLDGEVNKFIISQ